MSRTTKPTKRQEMRDERRRAERKQNWITITVIASVLVIVVGVIIYTQVINNRPVDTSTIAAPVAYDYPQPNGTALGDPNAPVKVVEYADFLCVYCREFVLKTEHSFFDKYVRTGKVYFKYTTFSFLAEESKAAAEAVYCANDQNKFWQMHNVLYQNITEGDANSYARTMMPAYAQKTGLDMNQFNTCFNQGKFSAQVAADLKDGQSKNVSGTPSFLVNGQLVYQDKLVETIDKALAGK